MACPYPVLEAQGMCCNDQPCSVQWYWPCAERGEVTKRKSRMAMKLQEPTCPYCGAWIGSGAYHRFDCIWALSQPLSITTYGTSTGCWDRATCAGCAEPVFKGDPRYEVLMERFTKIDFGDVVTDIVRTNQGRVINLLETGYGKGTK